MAPCHLAFGNVSSRPLSAPSKPSNITLQHDPGIVLARGATLTDSPTALSVSAILAEGAAALQLVKRRALNGFSVEFNAKKVRREHGVRVVERAELVGLSLVDKPAYPAAGAEVRAKSPGGRCDRKFRMTRRLLVNASPNVGPGSGGECIPIGPRFTKMAGELMADAFGEADRQHMMAVAGNFRRPLGSVSKGTLRGKSTDDGLEIEVDLPDRHAVGDEIVAAHEASRHNRPDHCSIMTAPNSPTGRMVALVTKPSPPCLHRRKRPTRGKDGRTRRLTTMAMLGRR